MYYTLDAIKSKKDLDGDTPHIFLITTNKTAGKTTAVLLEGLERFKKTNGRDKMLLIYRNKYEITSGHLLFSDVLKLYPEYGHEMTTVRGVPNLIYTLLLDGKVFGYAISMYKIDALKKYSPMFRDVETALLDEMQLEDGQYLKDEPAKLQGIIMAVGRGGGKQSRPFNLFLLGNNVSLMNPYFIYFGIHKRLKPDTHFMRGHGWVAEFGVNESAKKELSENTMLKAFRDSDYFKYSTNGEYLYNTGIFIESPSGNSRYLMTLIFDGKEYGIRDFYEEGLIGISKSIDQSNKIRICIKSTDHDASTVLINRNSSIFQLFRDGYEKGLLRFSDLESKNVMLDVLAIDFYKK